MLYLVVLELSGIDMIGGHSLSSNMCLGWRCASHEWPLSDRDKESLPAWYQVSDTPGGPALSANADG